MSVADPEKMIEEIVERAKVNQEINDKLLALLLPGPPIDLSKSIYIPRLKRGERVRGIHA